MKAEELSDLGYDREGRASGTTRRRREERHRGLFSTNNVGQNIKIVGLISTVSINCMPQEISSLSVQLNYPLKCSWANLKSCWPSSILSSPYWEPIATALRSRWEAALFQSPTGTAEKKQSTKRPIMTKMKLNMILRSILADYNHVSLLCLFGGC